MDNIFVEYIPEHYKSNVSITVHVKKSQFEGKFKLWFKAFIDQREIDLKIINKLFKNLNKEI